MEVKIVNPTFFRIHVLSVHLAPDAPSNCKIEHITPPLDCEIRSTTNVCKVILTGERKGEVETSVTISYESADSIQVVDVPIRGYVTYGKFVPIVKEIQIIGSQISNFSFFNFFKETVAVFAVSIESEKFSILDFKPFVIPSKSLSQQIYVLFHDEDELNDNIQTYLYIDTNITRLKIPVFGYNGNVSISNSSDFKLDTKKLFYNFSKVYPNSVKQLSFFIENPHPICYDIKFKNPKDSKIKIMSSRTIRVSPLVSQKVQIDIRFENTTNYNEQNQIIKFEVAKRLYEIEVTWTLAVGNIFITSTLPSSICLGTKVKIDLFAISTFDSNITIYKVLLPDGSEKKLKKLVLFPNIFTHIISVDYVVDLKFVKSFISYKKLNISVERDPFKPSLLPFEFVLDTKVFKIGSSVNVLLTYGTFQDLSYNFGQIAKSSINQGNVTVQNFLDTPVIFYVHVDFKKRKTVMLKSPVSAIIQPQQYFNITFNYRPLSEGQQKFTLRIATNSTPSFQLDIFSYSITPQFSFVNKWGDVSNSVEFHNMEARPIHHFLYIKNIANVTIPIAINGFVGYKVHYHHDCRHRLHPHKTCKINMTIDPKNFRFRKQKMYLVAQSCNKRKTYQIKVELKNESFIYIKLKRAATMLLVLLIGMYPIKDLISNLYAQETRGKVEYEKRIRFVKREIERLSVSKRASLGVQTVAFQAQVTGGRWQRSSLSVPRVTKQGIDSMTQILQDLIY
ncbi:hypothetical protein GPJ56_010344 [Histomonas meleagridis]|uniref:uncharacterized protein n=1 Tax=Histomonas meleagridis TaxID=135588 RepID=UPI00355A8124|nr:hypothetical protein GPJ56_010344 [Histomonas meleagridis]KAH0797951.1 hypothetical protein GO595_009580 [Histomonas meleagridis]